MPTIEPPRHSAASKDERFGYIPRMRFKLPLAIALYLGSSLAFGVERLPEGLHCEQSLSGYEFRLKSGFNPELKTPYNEGQSLDVNVFKHGDGLGHLHGSLIEDRFAYFSFHLFPEAQDKGLSKIYLKAFFEKFPDVDQTRDVLERENYHIYKRAFDRLRDQELAVRETPHYRALSSFGFREIVMLYDAPALQKLMIVLRRR